ncbi:biliverdin-producing heme oxygenase [Erythrobacter sp. SCSIO 43205]|uniref:biliverdin-producing heme oxygenase n=1 Tax=Erythrobacter sp. SCSIO 43205 TaxID=2779361 RepID=UPI001CA98F71|nr:biliverdin-producing heme oxygenase [Erythrobacter sp. SCSIO 43205]UAB78798.1 biliverdin-producing heme oxygenase [Erythrobacter sp. SCSIO 43205]
MSESLEPDRSKERRRQTLRLHLRGATAALHDRLDTAMRPPEDWRARGEYVRFLTTQYEARVPIEKWLFENAPEELTPPEQSPLLAHDIAALGAQLPARRVEFALKDKGDASMLGAAWVLAGSSLGNRAMLHDMRRVLPDQNQWPAAFLSSTAMTEFWQGLRPALEAPASVHDEELAEQAARQIFDHFLAVADAMRPQDRVEQTQ